MARVSGDTTTSSTSLSAPAATSSSCSVCACSTEHWARLAGGQGAVGYAPHARCDARRLLLALGGERGVDELPPLERDVVVALPVADEEDLRRVARGVSGGGGGGPRRGKASCAAAASAGPRRGEGGRRLLLGAARRGVALGAELLRLLLGHHRVRLGLAAEACQEQPERHRPVAARRTGVRSVGAIAESGERRWLSWRAGSWLQGSRGVWLLMVRTGSRGQTAGARCRSTTNSSRTISWAWTRWALWRCHGGKQLPRIALSAQGAASPRCRARGALLLVRDEHAGGVTFVIPVTEAAAGATRVGWLLLVRTRELFRARLDAAVASKSHWARA